MNAPVKIGDVLAGKYHIERVLGAGAMGVVVAARHLHLDERVAIKFLQPDTLNDANVVGRFLREGRAAAKIRSEHVARVYDVGSLDNGAPYLVMEYLEGSDLATLIRTRGPLPAAVAAEYLLQACEAIAEAHALGIVHRDIKPSNLFITTRPDGSPAIKVIDFGISKITPRSGEVLEMTKTADTRGSPLFMSPEHMTAPRSVDSRSDIWALGVTLYHLLTGGYPFYATGVPELCGLILQAEPAPLRMRRPDLPAGLEGVIARCLRKNPAERYTNIAELAMALGEFAPPLARLSVDRICRVQRGFTGQSHSALPIMPAIGPSPPAHGEQPTPPLPPRAPLPSTSAGASLGEAPPGATMQAQTGAVSWGSTRSLPAKRTTLIVLALGFIGVMAGAAILWVLRLDHDAAPDSPAASGVPYETAPANPPPAPPPSAVQAAPAEAMPAATGPALPPVPVQPPAAAPVALLAPTAVAPAGAASPVAPGGALAPAQPTPVPKAIAPQPAPGPISPAPPPRKKTPVKTEPF